jgi:hypothetical protein
MADSLIKIVFLILFFSMNLWACPNCGGSTNSFDGNKIFILSIFILLTYIPMSILFRMAIKNKKETPTDRNIC